MVRTGPIHAFLSWLFSRPRMDGLFDPWNVANADDADPNAWVLRRERLAQHLSAESPRLLLVGEAPGYQGCRVSGVAFTSERRLLEGAIPRVSVPFERLTTRHLPWSEPSATIVWKALYGLGLAEHTLLWNAVPWHPWSSAKGALSNRPPTAPERAAGLSILKSLIAALPADVKVVAVGNTAAASLADAGISMAAKLRHPANGGATKFRNGLASLVCAWHSASVAPATCGAGRRCRPETAPGAPDC